MVKYITVPKVLLPKVMSSIPTPNNIYITITDCSLSQTKLYIVPSATILPATVKRLRGAPGQLPFFLAPLIGVNQIIFKPYSTIKKPYGKPYDEPYDEP